MRVRWGWPFTVAVLSGALWFGAGTEAAFGLLRHERWDWTAMVVRGLLWALTTFGTQRFLQRLGMRPGERRARAELARFRSTGTLPSDADPSELRPLLRADRRLLAVARWYLLFVSTGLAVLVAASAVWANGNSPAVWAVAVVALVHGTALERARRARVDLSGRLTQELTALSR